MGSGLRDWLLRDNARGVAELSNQPISGRSYAGEWVTP